MATYDNDLRLKEIATGDESGTWGTSTNLNLELIGEALGYGTQDCFATDADATTTVADGAADPARAMYFKVTSSATLTATRVLTIAPNTVSRVMFIENATTGSQSITISQGSGANVTIATGRTAVVYLDGAGSGAAVVDALALVDPGVTDTLAEVLVAGNATGGTDIAVGTGDDITFADSSKAIFGAGSDLQIYHDGSNSYIVNTQGSLVISDSSSGAGDMSLQTNGSELSLFDSAGSKYMLRALTGGQVDLYHNGSAKLSTTATGIDVTGTVTADGLTVDGSGSFVASANDSFLSIAHTGTEARLSATYTSTGSWTPIVLRTQNESRLNIATNGDISFYEDTGTTAKFFWDASAESLGIGTSSPSGPLDVVSSSGAVGQYIRGRSSDNIGSLYFTSNASASTEYGYVQGRSTDLRIQGFNNGLILQPSGGNVGIGTSSPTGPLHVAGSDSTVPIKIDNTGTGGNTWRIWSTNDAASDGGGKLGFYNEDTATRAMTLDSSGNVGIGTSSPATKVEISGTGFQTLSVTSTNSSPVLKLNSAASSTAFLQWNNAGSSPLSFYDLTASAERMRIDSSGNVGINTTPKAWTSFVPVLQISTAAGGGGALAGTSADNFRMFANTYYDGSYKRLATGFATQYAQESGTHVWSYAASGAANSTFTWSEAARIDSSGNLLVGGTSAFADDSTTINSSGLVYASRAGNKSGHFNRQASDGEIVNFSKDGTTVGSIGTTGSNVVIGTGNTGLRFYDGGSAIIPHTAAGGSSNGLVDLGQGGFNQFKDLYLSGGVYLGGTGSANKLDDYEEGTWTPTLAVNGFSASATLSSATGVYTKIGNLVYINAEIVMSGQTYPSSYCQITGIPFTGSYSMSSAGVYDGVNPSSGTQGGSASGGATGLFLTPMGTTTTSTTWRISIVLTTA